MQPFDPLNLLLALAVNAAIAALSYRLSAVDFSGVAGGLGIGLAIWIGGGWQAYLLLLTFFVLGTAASKHKYGVKAARGIAQKKGGRRSAKHAFANAGVAALASVAHLFLPDAAWPLPCLAASLAAALADTFASELGQIYGRHPIALTTFKEVPVGTEGAVSLTGSVLGCLGGCAVAMLAWGFGVIDGAQVWIAAMAAFVAIHFESVLGGIFDIWHKDPNEALNFTQTAAAAVVMFLFIA